MNQQILISAAGLALAALTLAAQAQAPISGIEARAMDAPEVVEDHTPFRMSEADRRLTEQVIAALQADQRIRGRIAVSALDGVVMLSGRVDTVPMIYRAVEITDRIAQVRKVEVDGLHNS